MTHHLSRKERLRRALRREPVDRIPTQSNYTGAMARLLAAYFGVGVAELPDRLDNHLLRVDIDYSRPKNPDGSIEYDWWGAGWDTRTEGYWHAFGPLQNCLDLDNYPWPDPNRPSILTTATKTIQHHGETEFIVPNMGICLFERAWSLRGFDTLLMDLLERTEWVEELLDRITAIQLTLARRFVTAGVAGGYFGDDYGAQRAMLFSPKLWRRLIKPRLAALFSVFLDAGLPVILHSDGDIRAILPDLVEIGLTTLNPVQPEVLDHVWLQKEYGGHLSFYGGVSTQSILPTGTADQVRAATQICARTLSPAGTGLLLGASHRMQSDIPPANVEAMLNALSR